MKTRAIFILVVIGLFTTVLWPSDDQWIKVGAPEGGRITAITVGGGNIFAAANGTIYVSPDRGTTWKEIASGFQYAVSSLVAYGKDLFASGGKLGLLHYHSDGSRWGYAPGSSGDGPGRLGMAYSVVAIGETLYTFCFGQQTFRSTDGGKSWTKFETDWPYGKFQNCIASGSEIFALDPEESTVHISRDGGASWAELRSAWPGKIGIVDFAVDGTDLYVLTRRGVYRTGDNGANWAMAALGWPSSIEPVCLAAGSGLLCAGTSDGVYLSPDEGISWRSANSGLTGIAIATLGASRKGLLAGSGYGLFLSTDRGEQWKAHGSGLAAGRAVRYLGSVGANHFALGPSSSSAERHCLFVSIDDGASWRQTGPDLPQTSDFYCFAHGKDALFVGTDDGILTASADRVGWKKYKAGLPKDAFISALVLRGADIFAGTDEGVFRSADQGATWTPINSAGIDSSWISCFLLSEAGLFVGTGDGVLLITERGGWTETGPGLPDFPSVNDLLSDGGKLFAGTDKGVFISTDEGVSWKPCGGSPTSGYFSVEHLALAGPDLYAVDSRGHVWRLTLGDAAPGKRR
jgi:photosystem II stability/assembly factor-like uncharacterized protein